MKTRLKTILELRKETLKLYNMTLFSNKEVSYQNYKILKKHLEKLNALLIDEAIGYLPVLVLEEYYLKPQEKRIVETNINSILTFTTKYDFECMLNMDFLNIYLGYDKTKKYKVFVRNNSLKNSSIVSKKYNLKKNTILGLIKSDEPITEEEVVRRRKILSDSIYGLEI